MPPDVTNQRFIEIGAALEAAREALARARDAEGEDGFGRGRLARKLALADAKRALAVASRVLDGAHAELLLWRGGTGATDNNDDGGESGGGQTAALGAAGRGA